MSYSDHPGDVLRLNFTGQSITYVYTKAPNRGMAEVSIDGAATTLINLYSPTPAWQSYTAFANLRPGQHIIELSVSTQADPRASGHYVDLDRFQVTRLSANPPRVALPCLDGLFFRPRVRRRHACAPRRASP